MGQNGAGSDEVLDSGAERAVWPPLPGCDDGHGSTLGADPAGYGGFITQASGDHRDPGLRSRHRAGRPAGEGRTTAEPVSRPMRLAGDNDGPVGSLPSAKRAPIEAANSSAVPVSQR
jgi:hypothetical protein